MQTWAIPSKCWFIETETWDLYTTQLLSSFWILRNPPLSCVHYKRDDSKELRLKNKLLGAEGGRCKQYALLTCKQFPFWFCFSYLHHFFFLYLESVLCFQFLLFKYFPELFVLLVLLFVHLICFHSFHIHLFIRFICIIVSISVLFQFFTFTRFPFIFSAYCRFSFHNFIFLFHSFNIILQPPPLQRFPFIPI